MAEEKVESQEKQQKMVPLADLIAIKNRLKETTDRYEQATGEVQKLKNEQQLLDTELETAESTGDADKIVLVKRKLLQKNRELDRREAELHVKETTVSKRERKLRAEELAGQFGIEAELLLSAEDMEKEALRVSHERLSQEKLAQKESEPSRSIYETGAPPVSKKEIWSMTDEEFKKHKESLVRQAATRR